MEWLLWALTGITMEFGSDETFSHWAATRDDAGFIAIAPRHGTRNTARRKSGPSEGERPLAGESAQ